MNQIVLVNGTIGFVKGYDPQNKQFIVQFGKDREIVSTKLVKPSEREDQVDRNYAYAQ